MITTSNDFLSATGGGIKYKASDTHCFPTFYSDGGATVRVTFKDQGTDVELGFVIWEYTTAALTAFTASGANDVEKCYNLVEQAVKNDLETINPSATFTIV
jgi:hypothetical protein